MSSQRLVETRRCAAVLANSELGKHLPPNDQLTHTLLSCQRQQAVVLAVQTHVQQVFFRKMVGNEVGLEEEVTDDAAEKRVFKAEEDRSSSFFNAV